jgi:hypothetical protein
MNYDVHDRARILITKSFVESVSADEQSWIEAHIAACEECSNYHTETKSLVNVTRQSPVFANRAMVRSTQLRVRARAAEMQAAENRMNPVWITCAVAILWMLVSGPALWEGMQWLSAHGYLSAMAWQAFFGVAMATPAAAVAGVALWTRNHATA